MTGKSSPQPEEPKKSWLGKLLAGIGTLIAAPIIVYLVTHPAPPRPAPPIPKADPPIVNTVPQAAQADAPIVNTVPQADAPITVNVSHGEQCNHALPAPNVVVDGDTTKILLNAAGKTETPVALTGLHVSVSKRSQPPPANFEMCSGMAESVSMFAVDLDKSPPPVVPLPGRDKNNARAAPLDFPIDVTLSDRETIVVVASTQLYDCTWTIGLDWTANGQSGTWLVDNHGAPFRTMSTRPT
jgi:hypothetical protein